MLCVAFRQLLVALDPGKCMVALIFERDAVMCHVVTRYRPRVRRDMLRVIFHCYSG